MSKPLQLSCKEGMESQPCQNDTRTFHSFNGSWTWPSSFHAEGSQDAPLPFFPAHASTLGMHRGSSQAASFCSAFANNLGQEANENEASVPSLLHISQAAVMRNMIIRTPTWALSSRAGWENVSHWCLEQCITVLPSPSVHRDLRVQTSQWWLFSHLLKAAGF